jgi:hypothetical protein
MLRITSRRHMQFTLLTPRIRQGPSKNTCEDLLRCRWWWASTVCHGTSKLCVLRELDAAAIDAVKKWRFSPATKDGQRVPVLISVDVTFNIG